MNLFAPPLLTPFVLPVGLRDLSAPYVLRYLGTAGRF